MAISGTTLVLDIGIIIVTATVLAIIARLLKQPLLIGYILAGIVIGPELLGLVGNSEVITAFQELGVALLLFIVGLEIDLSKIMEVRTVVLATTLAQVLFLFGLGFWIMFLLGFGIPASLYTGLFIAFSSTAVLIKIMSENEDIESLHGRIIVGVLLIQDLIVILVLSIISTIGVALSTLNAAAVEVVLTSLLKGGGIFALAIVLRNYVMPYFFQQIEDSHELVFLSSLTVLFLFVSLSVNADIPIAVGGFLAGLSLTAFPYNIEISERARSIRDFFVTIFFVSLGMSFSTGSLVELWLPFVILLATVLLVKPLIIYAVTNWSRYGNKTSFYTGLSLAQVSEFSLVLAVVGLQMGHIGEGIASLATALMIVTIATTSYSVKYKLKIYRWFKQWFSFKGEETAAEHEQLTDHIVICGAHVKGRKLLEFFKDRDETVIAIDYDPKIVRELEEEEGIHAVYGDIGDVEVLEKANVAQAQTVISTVPSEELNRFLLNHVRQKNPDAIVLVSASDSESSLLMYDDGADYVLYPKLLAANEARDVVRRIYHDGEELDEAREEHIEHLIEEYEKDLLDRFEPDFLKHLESQLRKAKEAKEESEDDE